MSNHSDNNQKLDRLREINHNLGDFVLALKNKNNQLRQEVDGVKIENLKKKINL